MPFSQLKLNRPFGGTFRPHLALALLPAGFFFALLFNRED
jgi:hypothetical protein